MGTLNSIEAANRQSWRRTFCVVIVAFLPLMLYWTYVYILWPWRWYDCFDPEGIHYAAGLSMLQGHAPGNVDNPATPLQFLSAILCGISGCGVGDLEQFRPLAYAITIGLRIVAAIFVVQTIFRDLPMAWQIALLWLPWLAPDYSFMSRQWCPETLYFPLGMFAIVALNRAFIDVNRWQLMLLAGAAIGVMIGVKFIFVAWAVAALLAVAISQRPPGAAKSNLALAGGLILGFVIATLPAVARYPRMFDWIVGLASKTGQYGSGPEGLLDPGKVAENLSEIIRHQTVWTSLVVGILVALVIRRPRSTLTHFCILAILGSYALALKHFAPRYLAPTGLMLALAVVELVRGLDLKGMKWSGLVAVTVIGLLLGKSLAFDMEVHKAYVAERRDSEELLTEFLTQHGRTSDSVILYGWRAYVPAFSARFMSHSEANQFRKEVDAAYPNEGVIVSWPDHLYYPDGKSMWDFIVVGYEFADRDGLSSLRQHYQNWDVGRYVVIKNVNLTPPPAAQVTRASP